MAEPRKPYEGLEVAYNNAPESYSPGEGAPEVYPDPADKFVYSGSTRPLPSPESPKLWFGIPRKRASLILAAVALVIVGGVVGGVAGGLSSRNNNRQSTPSTAAVTATPSPSTTGLTTSSTASLTVSLTASNSPVPTSGVLALNCPAINGTQHTATSGSTKNTFLQLCVTDLTSNSKDISASLKYSLDSCIDSCTSHNAANQDPQCQGLTFGANLTRYADANCFLKTAITGTSKYTLDEVQAGALLLT